MTQIEVLRAGHDRTQELVDRMSPQDLSRPTPCSEWDVRALLAHVVAATDGLVAMLHDEKPDWGKDALGDDPAATVRQSLTASLEAWQEPGSLERPSRQMPGMLVVDFALADAVAHAWDLASALGQPLGLDDELVAVVHQRWDGEPAETARTYEVFGPRVDVPADASATDRFLGLTGRDPGWRPPG